MVENVKKDSYNKCSALAVKQLMEDTALMDNNTSSQSNINTMRSVLQPALGLSTSSFIKIPSLYKPTTQVISQNPLITRTADVAHIPGMVNCFVDGTKIIMAKPFGPKDDSGKNVLKEYVKRQLPGCTIQFVDDWTFYHIQDGEIHCGTNATRTPPTVKWWAE